MNIVEFVCFDKALFHIDVNFHWLTYLKRLVQ